MKAKYDTIGANYNRTRKADPYLTERLWEHLRPQPGGLYLDIGCGTGNYTNALQRKGYRFIGIDPSREMLDKARAVNPDIDWRPGTAEDTGLDRNSVDAIMATLTLHHWPSLERGFTELYRVLKGGGRLVIFTSTPEQMRGYWLNHYFPDMMAASIAQMPSLEQVSEAMTGAGFAIIRTEKHAIRADLEDLFLYSGKHKPSLYLEPEVRQGISSFSALAPAEEVEAGLEQLQADLLSGKIFEVMRAYENDRRDYLYIIGKKA